MLKAALSELRSRTTPTTLQLTIYGINMIDLFICWSSSIRGVLEIYTECFKLVLIHEKLCESTHLCSYDGKMICTVMQQCYAYMQRCLSVLSFQTWPVFVGWLFEIFLLCITNFFFLLALWVHSVTVLNRVSELNKVSKMRDINCEQGLSPTLLKQFHHPPENPTSVFLRAGRLCPPSISTLPRLSVSLLFLFPSCSFSSSVFVSPSISPPPLTSGICALDTDGDYRKPGEAENLKMDFCFT